MDKGELGVKDIFNKLMLKHRPTLMYGYLQPAINEGFIEMTQSESPKSPTQKYRLTTKGEELRKQLLQDGNIASKEG